MSFDDALDLLRSLSWPCEEYLVFGSGPLAVRGIRHAADLDVVVGHTLWSQLVQEHQPCPLHEGVHHFHIGPIEVLDGWWPHIGEPEELIGQAEMVGGLPFAPLSLVLRWKRASGRPKDLADIDLIEAYLIARPDLDDGGSAKTAQD
jgi:hypothetical protein